MYGYFHIGPHNNPRTLIMALILIYLLQNLEAQGMPGFNPSCSIVSPKGSVLGFWGYCGWQLTNGGNFQLVNKSFLYVDQILRYSDKIFLYMD